MDSQHALLNDAETDCRLQPWQHVWREGIAPLLSDQELTTLRDALIEDSPELIQRRTYQSHNPNVVYFDAPVAASCALCYPGWKCRGKATCGQLDAFFEEFTAEINQRMKQAHSASVWVIWFDATPRAEMRQALLREVELSLKRRCEGTADPGRQGDTLGPVCPQGSMSRECCGS